MPMRLGVRLHMRRSAKAGVALNINIVIPAAAKRRAGSHPRAPAPWIPDGRVPRPSGRPPEVDSVHEDDAAVIDVGSGRSAGDEVAETREEICLIVVGEEGRRVEAERPGAGKRGLVD